MDEVTYLFLFFCIPLRILEVIALAIIMQKDLVGEHYESFKITFGAILSIQATGFFASDILGREQSVLGRKKWWISTLNGIFFLMALIALIIEFEYAFVFLIVDVIYGFFSWIKHHYK